MELSHDNTPCNFRAINTITIGQSTPLKGRLIMTRTRNRSDIPVTRAQCIILSHCKCAVNGIVENTWFEQKYIQKQILIFWFRV